MSEAWKKILIEVAPAFRGAGTTLHAVGGLPARWMLEKLGLDPDNLPIAYSSLSLCGDSKTSVDLVSRDDPRRRNAPAGDVTCPACRGLLRSQLQGQTATQGKSRSSRPKRATTGTAAGHRPHKVVDGQASLFDLDSA